MLFKIKNNPTSACEAIAQTVLVVIALLQVYSVVTGVWYCMFQVCNRMLHHLYTLRNDHNSFS